MPIERKSITAPLPSTARSVPVHLSYDAKSNKLLYCSGKSVFVVNADPKLSESAIQFVQHNANTTVAKFAPSGFYILSADESGNVKIWDCVGEDLIVKGEYPVISGRINDIAWDLESKRIIAVGNGKERMGHCFTWDSGNTVGEISGHSAQINAVTIKPNRPYRAATVSDDAGLVFMQGPPFKFSQSVRGHHTNFVKDVAYSADGEYIVSVGADRKIVVYEGKTGEFIKEIINDFTGGIYGISWDVSNPKQFVACSADASVKLFNVESGEIVKSWALEKSVDNQQLGVVSTKDYIISLSLNGNLNYFTLDSETPSYIVEGHQKSITALTAVSSSLKVYSGSYDGRIIEWDEKISNGKEIKASSSVLKHSNLIVSITESDNGNVSTTLWDDTLKTVSGSEFVSSSQLGSQPKLMSSNGLSTVVVTSEDKIISFSKGEKSSEKSFDFELSSLILLSDKYLIVGSAKDNKIHVLDPESLEIKSSFTNPMQSKPNVALISPNEEYVAVGDVMGKIVLYNIGTLAVQTSRWSFHTLKVNSLSWNLDNDHVSSGSLDTNLIVYSVATPGKNVKFLNSHKDGVNCVKWIDASTFVSGGNDGTIKSWTYE